MYDATPACLKAFASSPEEWAGGEATGPSTVLSQFLASNNLVEFKVLVCLDDRSFTRSWLVGDTDGSIRQRLTVRSVGSYEDLVTDTEGRFLECTLIFDLVNECYEPITV